MSDNEKPPAGDQATGQPAEGAPLDAAALKAELEKLTAKYERAQADLVKFRTRAEEVEAAKKAAAEKALAEKSLEEQLAAFKAKAQELEKLASEKEREAVLARREAKLAGKVVDPAAALRLLDEEKHIAKDGSVDVEALLRDYPFLAIEEKQAVNLPGAGTRKGGAADLQTQAMAALKGGNRAAAAAMMAAGMVKKG